MYAKAHTYHRSCTVLIPEFQTHEIYRKSDKCAYHYPANIQHLIIIIITIIFIIIITLAKLLHFGISLFMRMVLVYLTTRF